MEKNKKRWGDRKDGRLIRDIDSLHFVMAHLYPGRCNNEAYINERIDLTNINAYLAKKNLSEEDYKYNIFQVVVTIILKVLTLRPKLNRFIMNGYFYMHDEVSVSFVVKTEFADDGAERLAFIHAKPGDTIEDVHEYIKSQVKKTKAGGSDGSTQDGLDFITKLPRPIGKFATKFVAWLDKHGHAPDSLIASDPAHSSCVISNLGSIKMQSGYHHLVSWGTCSMICLIGEIKDRPFFKSDGSFDMRPSVDVGITLDERLADGYYYSKTMRLIRALAAKPELLEKPLSEDFEY